MDDPHAVRRANALRIAARLAMDSDDPTVAEFAREVHSRRHTTRELLCSAGYDEMLRGQLTPMINEWTAMSEADQQRTLIEAGDASELRLIEAFELAEETAATESPDSSEACPSSPETGTDDDYFENLRIEES